MRVGIVALAVALLAASSAAAADASPPFAVFAYLPEYRLGGFDYDAAFQSGVTHLLFFSLEVDPSGALAAIDRLPSRADAAKARAAADRVGGKLLLSLGGNARSENFGVVATSAKRRGILLRALRRLCKEYGFDGVDYNWEYPSDHSEWAAWATLMEESRKRLAYGPNAAVVTFTMYLDPKHYKVIRRYKLLEHADYVHCMAYDQPGQHSTVEFFTRGLRLARKHGFDLSKFTMGVPFYGRDVRSGEPKTYYELEPQLDDADGDVHGTQYFNSRRTIVEKTRLALAAGAGGVMVWEIGQDVQPVSRRGSLTTALQSALPRPLMGLPAGGQDGAADGEL